MMNITYMDTTYEMKIINKMDKEEIKKDLKDYVSHIVMEHNKKNKKILLNKIDIIKTYDDIIDVISITRKNFKRYKGIPKCDLITLGRLKENIEIYNTLVNNDIIKADLNIYNENGCLMITYQDIEGYVDKINILVKIRRNTKKKDIEIFIYPYDNIVTIDIPYKE